MTIDWKNEHSECVAALASSQATIALLPQPFVTVAQSKIDGLRMALDLTAEWDKLGSGSSTHHRRYRRPPRDRGAEPRRGGRVPEGVRRLR